MQDQREAALEQLQAALAQQNADWQDTKQRLLALGDVELSIDPDVIADLESATRPIFVGSIPAGLTRM